MSETVLVWSIVIATIIIAFSLIALSIYLTIWFSNKDVREAEDDEGTPFQIKKCEQCGSLCEKIDMHYNFYKKTGRCRCHVCYAALEPTLGKIGWGLWLLHSLKALLVMSFFESMLWALWYTEKVVKNAHRQRTQNIS